MSFGKVTLGNSLKQLAQYGDKMEQAALNGRYRAGLEIQGQTQKKIQEVSSGSRPVVRYSEAGVPRERMAAPAGEAPNTDTGTLVRSGETIKKGGEVYVQFRTEYAFELEMSHPYLVPTFKENKSVINAYVREEIKKI